MFINVPFRQLVKGEDVMMVLFTYSSILGGVLGVLAITTLYLMIIGCRKHLLSAKKAILFLLCGVYSIVVVLITSDFQSLSSLIMFSIPPLFVTLHFTYLQRSYFKSALTSTSNGTKTVG